MIRLCAIFLTLICPAFAMAQVQGDVMAERMWNTFMRICPLMLTDPQAYAKQLQIPGPDGERVVSQMADGNVVEFDTTVDGFSHSSQILVIGKHQEIGCSMNAYSIGQPEEILMPEKTMPMFERRIQEYADVQVMGGQVDKEVPSPVEGYPVEKVTNYHQFWVTGLVPDVDAVAQVIFGEGVISYHMHRYMVGETE
ncbi:MAG: hypothetical protein AAF665_00020 [Pseudomonadota bacterium]